MREESVNSKSLPMMNDVPLGQPELAEQMKSEAEPASEAASPRRQMTDQHRRHLSRSIKMLWARRGGLSSEHRQKISASHKKRYAERRQMLQAD